MAEPVKEPIRVLSGQPALRRSAADMDRLSEITPDDVDAARKAWKRLAPAGFQGLIDAKVARKSS